MAVDIATFLTPEEIAKDLKISVPTIKRRIQSQDLRGVRIGKLYRVSRDAYAEWLSRHSTASQGS